MVIAATIASKLTITLIIFAQTHHFTMGSTGEPGRIINTSRTLRRQFISIIRTMKTTIAFDIRSHASINTWHSTLVHMYRWIAVQLSHWDGRVLEWPSQCLLEGRPLHWYKDFFKQTLKPFVLQVSMDGSSIQHSLGTVTPGHQLDHSNNQNDVHHHIYSNVGRLFCTPAPPKFTKKLAVDSFFNFGSWSKQK